MILRKRLVGLLGAVLAMIAVTIAASNEFIGSSLIAQTENNCGYTISPQNITLTAPKDQVSNRLSA